MEIAHKNEVTKPWPPAYFSPLDVAIMAETLTRERLYGLDYENKNQGKFDIEPVYPNDQSHPQYVRKYLCWLALSETRPDSKIGLFLPPVAFIGNVQRQEWYLPTGHKSRYYATADEFLDYAKDQLYSSKYSKDAVLGLLTPWFFDIPAVAASAKRKGRPIPTEWEHGCFRAGMMVCVAKIKPGSKVQLIYFKPVLPHYEGAAELAERLVKQNAWLDELTAKVEAKFKVAEGWIRGTARLHIKANPGRKVPADSVESSCEIIEEIMQNPKTLPYMDKEFEERHFKLMPRYGGV
ncbi:hypothetical protein GGS26DRAFT_572659 [Hypomontagnella submonticulosa]|nr:hypothetical protein GGS26DRAFT_572659 [Hypomontagnella submonticulosa]